jgi:hypothetical protein
VNQNCLFVCLFVFYSLIDNCLQKACSLCEDERLSRTGVCICCDAGMCKSYFHVTCAQREGMLSESHSADEVDPFFAYCKLHADRATVKSKRRNWLALQSKFKSVNVNVNTNQRIQLKLSKQRAKWKANRIESEVKTWGKFSSFQIVFI